MSRTVTILALLLAAVGAAAADLPEAFADATGWNLHGFADFRLGMRTRDDPWESRDLTLGEGRLQLELDRYFGPASVRVRSDFLYDDVEPSSDVDLEEGQGWWDLREANVLFSPLPTMDLKIGRQILTWGTGNLLFLNDLFPKDWRSFFAGRDVEYLKAPSDAVFASWFGDLANVDVAFMPRFDPDRYITGERNSYWNAALGRRAGEDNIVDPTVPDRWLDDYEVAMRLSRTVGDVELAAYGYTGYWKSPGGMDPTSGQAIFPRLNVYGASARGTVLGGIGNAETAYYQSRQDEDGDDPFVNNSEWRFLVGYQRELKADLSLGLQYYVEWMQDYDAYKRALGGAPRARDEYRQVATVNLTQMLLSQNLMLDVFAYYSPTDNDAYLRPSASYKLTDAWQVSLGANIFLETWPHTFFGQFEHNSNVYAGIRYSF